MKQPFFRGFTLIEMLVVVGIIGVFASIVLFSISGARANARDKARISDLKQYELAIRLYVEKYGRLPAVQCTNGFRLDSGNSAHIPTDDCVDDGANQKTEFLTFLNQYFGGGIPTDPRGPNNPDYYYYYDPTHNNCPGTDANLNPMIFAVNMERSGNSNQLAVCGTENTNDNGGGLETTAAGASNPYIIHLGTFR